MIRRRVAITQPHVPHYRVPLWETLISMLREVNVEARVFYGGYGLRNARERGEVGSEEWAREVPTRSVRLPTGAWFEYRKLPAEWARSDLLLTEMAAGNGNAWSALTRSRPYVLMGHGKGYVAEESKPGILMESMLIKHSAHALTYTAAGQRAVMARTKLHHNRVTSFDNTIDATQLRESFDSISPASIQQFRATHSIPVIAKCAVYLGALEPYKNIELLCESARLVFNRDPNTYLIVVGTGSEYVRIQELAIETNRVVYLGHVVHSDLGILGHTADLIVNPGRIGLVAVDAAILGIPVLTTNDARHAPEVEYLESSGSLHSVETNSAAFADAWVAELRQRRRRVTVQVPTIEQSAAKIAGALLGVLRSRA